MDADKWGDYYDRTKKEDGEKSAMVDLVNGMLRELKSRMEQAKPWDQPSDIAENVNDLYREVASSRPELRKEGFADLVQKHNPEIGALFSDSITN